MSSLHEEIGKLLALRGPTSVSLVKQLITPNTHVTIGERGRHLFHADEGHSIFYWYGDAESRNVYVPKRHSKIIIARMNGLLHLEDLVQDHSKMVFSIARDKSIRLKVASSGLKVIFKDGIIMAKLALAGDVIYDLVPDDGFFADKTSVFSPNFDLDVYHGIGFKLVRDFCSHHRVVVKGAMSEPAEELKKYANLLQHINIQSIQINLIYKICYFFRASVTCLEFPETTSVQFVRHQKDLLILSFKARLLLEGFYGGRGGTLPLAIKLDGKTMKPKEFMDKTSGAMATFR